MLHVAQATYRLANHHSNSAPWTPFLDMGWQQSGNGWQWSKHWQNQWQSHQSPSMLHNNYNQVHHHGAGYVAPIQQKQLKKEIQKQMRAVMLGRGPGGAVASHPTAPDLNCPPRVCNECNTEHHNPKLKVCRKCRAVLPAVVETAKEVQPSKSYKDTLLAKAVPAPVNIKQAH